MISPLEQFLRHTLLRDLTAKELRDYQIDLSVTIQDLRASPRDTIGQQLRYYFVVNSTVAALESFNHAAQNYNNEK